jgi:hypothetical protein
MRKLRVSILLTIVALLMLVPMIGPTQKVNALGYEKYYTVYYDYGRCIIGPEDTRPAGEWFVDCYGNWSGYGWRPSEHPDCSYFELTYGEQCFLE